MKGRARIKGQAATEYMLLISVVVVAVVAASYNYVPAFQVAVFNLGERVQLVLDTGTIGGVGFSRDGSVGGDFGEDGRTTLPDGEL